MKKKKGFIRINIINSDPYETSPLEEKGDIHYKQLFIPDILIFTRG